MADRGRVRRTFGRVVPDSGFVRYLLAPVDGAGGSRPRAAAIKVTRAYLRDRWRISPRRLGARVDRIPLDRPIFLLGTQGSGGTLIGRCLRRSPEVVTVSGDYRQWTGIDELGIVPNRMARLPRSLWGSSHRSDIAHPTLGATHSSAFACSELLPLYRRTGPEAADDGERFRRLLREHVAVYARDPSRGRFLDKTHANTVKVPLIAALLEGSDPLFVLVVRNPYAACCWALERKPPSFRDGLPWEERLRLIAEHWENAHRIVLEDAELVPNVALVRFEDFHADSGAVVRALCDFVGLEYDEAMVPGPGQRRPWATLPGDRKWFPLYADDRLRRVTDEQAAIIARSCGALAERFGYGRDGAAPRAGPIEVLGGGAR